VVALAQRDGSHGAIAHAFAALDALVHISGRRAVAGLFQRLYGAYPHGGARVILRTTVAVDANDGIRTDGLFLFRFTAEELTPNIVAQLNTSTKLRISLIIVDFWGTIRNQVTEYTTRCGGSAAMLAMQGGV